MIPRRPRQPASEARVSVQWIQFKSDADIPAFLDAALQTHRALFDRLAPDDRPHFFDYWQRLLNHSNAWRLGDGRETVALVTVPRVADLHSYRWHSRTLAWAADFAGGFNLPPDMNLERSFVVPADLAPNPMNVQVIAGAAGRCVQTGYVAKLAELGTTSPPDGLSFRAFERDDLEPVLELLHAGYASQAEPEPDLSRQRVELRQVLDADAGWCFVATTGGSERPVAVASYILLQIPLVGVPAALVGDLAVRADFRGRGLARTLQRWAADRLRDAGLRWIFGNILPDNPASQRQAAAVGRAPWYCAVRFER